MGGTFRSLSQAIPALASLRYLSVLCLDSVSIHSLEDVCLFPCHTCPIQLKFSVLLYHVLCYQSVRTSINARCMVQSTNQRQS